MCVKREGGGREIGACEPKGESEGVKGERY